MVAHVLLLEPSDDLREMVSWTLGHLGHAVSVDAYDAGSLTAVILEPADAASLSKARTLVAARPGLPIICVSIEPRHAIAGLQPAAYLVKPFSLAQLKTTLGQVLLSTV